MFHYFTNENLSNLNGLSATISLKTWLLFHLLSLFNLIPFIGTLVWLALYLIIGLSSDTAPSIRNYVKLQIIISAICMAFAVIICVLSFNLFSV